jgi:hypothetical protein
MPGRTERCCGAVIESSIPAVLEGRARQKPDDVAYTFVDYEVDPAGFAESLTWSQVTPESAGGGGRAVGLRVGG